MRAFFDRAFAIIFYFAAPEDGLPFVVDGFQLEPHIEGINCSAREKMPDFPGSHDDIHAEIIAAPNCGIDAAKRGGDRAYFPDRSRRRQRFGLLTDREGCRNLGLHRAGRRGALGHFFFR